MQRLNQIVLRMIAMATLACAMAACSSDLSLTGVTLVPKPETLLRKPDWANFSGSKNDFELRPVTAADLVSAEGQCDSGAGQAAADPTAGGGLVAGGIALQMTECDVVRRAPIFAGLGRGFIASRAGAWYRSSVPRVRRPRRRKRRRQPRRNQQAPDRASVVRHQGAT